jgi:hypothetical protein
MAEIGRIRIRIPPSIKRGDVVRVRSLVKANGPLAHDVMADHLRSLKRVKIDRRGR